MTPMDKKETRGGYRPNSGSKKGQKKQKTLLKEEARELLRQMFFDEIELIGGGLLAKAKGIWFFDTENKKIYKKEPDTKAIEILIEHTMGKAPQSEPDQMKHYFPELTEEQRERVKESIKKNEK